jgi:hypothetical protein
MTGVFRYWAMMPLKRKRAKYVHPADREVFTRVQHHFELRCLPSPFAGPLRTAPVVLLYLSPGLHRRDIGNAKSRSFRKFHAKRLGGLQPLPGPMDLFKSSKWFLERTKSIGTFDNVRRKIAVLNISPYHSRTFNDMPLLTALPSCRVALEWAQQVLFPEAIAGKRIVVCMRAARF